MPMHPFSFLRPDDPKDSNGKNWQTFDEATKTIVKTDLSVTNPTATPVVNSGTFTLYGPIVFYDIMVTLNNNDGWTTSSYINIPYPALVSGGTMPACHLGHAFIYNTGIIQANTFIASGSNPNRLTFSANYTNVSGGDQIIYLQGWYYRG